MHYDIHKSGKKIGYVFIEPWEFYFPVGVFAAHITTVDGWYYASSYRYVKDYHFCSKQLLEIILPSGAIVKLNPDHIVSIEHLSLQKNVSNIDFQNAIDFIEKRGIDPKLLNFRVRDALYPELIEAA